MIENDKVYFWKPDKPFGIFSPWFMLDFTDNEGKTFCCLEQYIDYRKALMFNDSKSVNLIMANKDPKTIQNIAKNISNFNFSQWEKEKYWVCAEGNFYKFYNKKERKILMDTRDKEIYYASPYDKIWGTGVSPIDCMNGIIPTGQNLLGKALIEARNEFATHSYN